MPISDPQNRHHIRHQHGREPYLGNSSSWLWKGNSSWNNSGGANFLSKLEENKSSLSPGEASGWAGTTVRSVMESVLDSHKTLGDLAMQEDKRSTSLNNQELLEHYNNFLRTNGTNYTGKDLFMDNSLTATLHNRSFLPALEEGDHHPPLDSFQSFIYSIVIPLMLLFCLVSALINLLIVLSVRWCRKPMSPTLYFSFSLALADAFASTVLGTGLVINSLLPTVYNIEFTPCFSLALEAFRLGGVLVTVAHLLALSINYWIGIVRPLQYAATMTRGTALKVIISSWICPIALLLLAFASLPDQGFQSDQCEGIDFLYQQTFRLLIAVFFFTPLILMMGIYSHIFIIVRNHLSYNIKYQNCVQLRRNVKAIVTTCLILGTYIIGWMPAILWYVLVCENCLFHTRTVPVELSIPVSIVINVLVILKALLDPIIYALRMSDIQAALKKMRYDFFLWIFESCAPTRNPRKPAGSEIGRRSSSRSNNV